MAKEPAPKPTEEEIRAAVEANRVNPPEPTDLSNYTGKYKYLPTGEIFGLKILPDSDVRCHKTHTAKNATKFWDGTADQFRELFDKV